MMTILCVQIGEMLKAARMRQYPRISQEDASVLVGVHRVTYANYEREAQPIPDVHLIKLAEAWNAPELLGFITAPLVTVVRVPFWGTVPAGNWAQPTADPEFITVPAAYADERTVAVRVGGDSMTPAFIPGDILLCASTNTVSPPAIVLVRSDDQELTVKRLIYKAGEPVLVADNPDYPVLERKRAQIVAVVQRLIRDV